MKSQLQKLVIAASFLLISFNLNAQVVSDSVSILPGYSNQTFYSLSNGTVSSVSNTDWDLAFQLKGFSGSILINSKNNVQLWDAQKDVSQWANIYASDTTGIVSNQMHEFHNSDSTWNRGAFNLTNNISNPFDLGWGVYNPVTHIISGDSIYFIKLSNGNYKKLMIETLNGVTFEYFFKFADLDGSNEISVLSQKQISQEKISLIFLLKIMYLLIANQLIIHGI